METNEINGAMAFLRTYICAQMSAAWHKSLAAIDICNKVFQARYVTLDVEVSNFEILLDDLM